MIGATSRIAADPLEDKPILIHRSAPPVMMNGQQVTWRERHLLVIHHDLHLRHPLDPIVNDATLPAISTTPRP